MQALDLYCSTARPYMAYLHCPCPTFKGGFAAPALQCLQAEGHSSVARDPLIPDLLQLPPGTDLHAHKMVQDGRLVLQVITWLH
jgi:hypothetical protein